MNAVADTHASNQGGRLVAAPHATHTFKLLLKREFWEHKGGFFWAPLITSGIAVFFTVLAAIGGTLLKQRSNNFEIDNNDAGEIARALGGAGDVALMGGIAIALLVLGVVVFFYCLGSLYDDRKDRSVLFWKSLPVSDTATVSSKVVWALGLAPLLAIAIGITTGLAFWMIAAFTTSINGLPGASGVLTHSHPFRIIGNAIAMVPLYMLWALPAVGWLMLCSSAVRSKPFLWAVIAPVLGCALASFINLILGFGFNIAPMWYAVAYRPLLSVFPATWMPALDFDVGRTQRPDDIANIVDATQNWTLAATADLWIGAVAGAAMIFGAIQLRRRRELAD